MYDPHLGGQESFSFPVVNVSNFFNRSSYSLSATGGGIAQKSMAKKCNPVSQFQRNPPQMNHHQSAMGDT